MHALRQPALRISEAPFHSRVLLADFDDRRRARFARELTAAGFDVTPAATIDEAQTLCVAGAVDSALLVDFLEHPEKRYKGDVSLTKRFHELFPRLRIVVVSSHDSIAHAVNSIKAGASDYFPCATDLRVVEASLKGSPVPAALPEEPMSADRMMWEYINRVTAKCNGRLSVAAFRMNMHYRTLQRRLSKRAPQL